MWKMNELGDRNLNISVQQMSVLPADDYIYLDIRKRL